MKKIAVTYENGQVFQHFGHTEYFKIYCIEDGKVTFSTVMSSNGSGHGALASYLSNLHVDALICGGIGGGAQVALKQQGIAICAGVSGDADEAVAAYINGTLVYSESANCSHHDHEHGEGHTCGEHGCGGHGEGEGHTCGEHCHN